jgi:hypothetical protein
MWILLFAAPSSSSSELYLQNSHKNKTKSKKIQTKIELKCCERSDSRLIAIANPNGVKSIHSTNASIGQLIFSLCLSLLSVSLRPWLSPN